MRQLIQYLKDGKMELSDVPFPAVQANSVLVRNAYSVISTGTEGKTVGDARLGYIKKAKARPNEVRQVIELAKSEGVFATYHQVKSRLDAPTSLGYSCAGEVMEVGEHVTQFRVGDFVACGGEAASHAEVVSVSKNLCARVPEGVSLKEAACTTVAAIALQGIRQADPKIGESSAIIGLGLVGLITAELLKAAGVRVIGIDILDWNVHQGKKIGCDLSLNRNQPDLQHIVDEFTEGYGVDKVIITAGTNSKDPIELAGTLCRRKGQVIVVGSVPTGFSRANYYQKELELRMSCSYGPGRYDSSYEEKAIDYPYAYVRWTEKRNMQAFLGLLEKEQVKIEPLITHVFDFSEAPQAYDLILSKREPSIGILLKYNAEVALAKKIHVKKPPKAERVKVGFIGAGSFAQNFLLPEIKDGADLVGVATASGCKAKHIAAKYRFGYATGNANDIIEDASTNTVFIVTRHDLHAQWVIKALAAGKNVFVEKPLALHLSDLEEIKSVYEELHEREKPPPRLMVGYNRRFSPHVKKLKEVFSADIPKAINYRINAGIVGADHWTQDTEIGGGRIIGEVCHFVDLCMYLAGAKLVKLSASVMKSPQNLMDTLVITLEFANGSVGSVSYFSNGNKSMPKERIELFCHGQMAVIDDFKILTIHNHQTSKFKLSKQDKGHRDEVSQFLQSIRDGGPSIIPFEELYLSSLSSFKILESIQRNATVHLN